jgi:hypothetical protein
VLGVGLPSKETEPGAEAQPRMAELGGAADNPAQRALQAANGQARDRFLARLGFLDHFGKILRRGTPNGTRTPVTVRAAGGFRQIGLRFVGFQNSGLLTK